MDAATPLPWDVSLTYYLDRAQIAGRADEEERAAHRVRGDGARRGAEVAGLADFAGCVMRAQGRSRKARSKWRPKARPSPTWATTP
ncbi:MAG: hypothetical protein ACLTMP_07740 [Eggerthella lenta]